MARGHSRASSEGASPFNKPNDPVAEVSDLMEGFLGSKKMPDGFDDLDENAWESISEEVAYANMKESDRREIFDDLVIRAQEALDNPSELSTDLETMSYLVPLTAAEAKAGKRPRDVIREAFETAKSEDGGYDDAVRRDASFRDNDGSFEERYTVNWVKDFLTERVENAAKERANYDKDLKQAREAKIFRVVQNFIEVTENDRDRERRESYPRGDREDN